MTPADGRRLRRLGEELEESGVPPTVLTPLVLEEVDRAMRPAVHERKAPSSGTILEPTSDAGGWEEATGLEITRQPVGEHPIDETRRFADGLSSWLVRRAAGDDEWMVFDRPAGSERDLVVLAEAFGATLVQRHPSGTVRIVGSFGVLRWTGFLWHLEPPVAAWLDPWHTCPTAGHLGVLTALLEFAVHDLGANGIGALLVYRPTGTDGPVVEERYPTPPALRIGQPFHLAPLRHALAQVDGAAVFDQDGVLRRLGVRLVPSSEAEVSVDAYKGTRHTSGRRYSYDDPQAVVIAVSEDGPVTVIRNGEVLGRSPTDP